jgi:TniQ
MSQVTFTSAHWHACFPHVTEPYPDEWLAGLLLRCDEMNHYESGTTFRTLLRETIHPGLGPGSAFLVIPETMLEALARHLTVSQECLLATTYARELARLYTPLPTHAGPRPRRGEALSSFLGKRMGHRSSATREKFHICPVCIAQTRLLQRTVVLPHLKYCPTHHVAFSTHCLCGSPLFLDQRGQRPFTCFTCGESWARLPRLSPAPEVAIVQRDLRTLYAFFLVHGTSDLLRSALSLIRYSFRTHRSLTLELVSGRTCFVPTERLDFLALGDMVDLLVTLGISPDDIMRNTLISPSFCVR